MPTEPVKDTRALLEAIRQAYAFPVVSLDYLPVGMVGSHYRADCADGQHYFVTLYNHSRLAHISVQRLGFTLPLTYQLQQSGQFTNLAAPLPTTAGELQVDFQGFPLVLYPYLDGRLLMDEMPYSDETQAELGRLVARLHAASQNLALKNPVQETFTFHFEQPLRRGLEILPAIGSDERWGRVALRDLLLPQRQVILALLERLHNLAEPMRRQPPPMVVCHTDMHGANILRTPEGRLVVVDWEGVMLAPPEHDLFIFTGAGFETFLSAYWQAGGVKDLSASRFAFYFYRRNLEDLTDWVVRILDENTDLEQDRADLDGIQHDCLDGWPDLQTAIPRMQAVLDTLKSEN